MLSLQRYPMPFVYESTEPRQIYDTGIGQLVDSIDCNAEAACNLMNDKGLTPEQIGNATIHFTADRPQCEDIGDEYGSYSDYTLTVHIGSVTRQYLEMSTCAVKIYNGFASREASQTLVHEVSHFTDDLIMNPEDVLTENVLHLAATSRMTSHRRYLADPREKRAFTAERRYAREVGKRKRPALVSLGIKSPRSADASAFASNPH